MESQSECFRRAMWTLFIPLLYPDELDEVGHYLDRFEEETVKEMFHCFHVYLRLWEIGCSMLMSGASLRVRYIL